MIDNRKIEAVVRHNHGRLVAALTGRFKDITVAEDALQDALVEALSRWSNKGWPSNPTAWLMTVASRKAIDRLRRQNLYQTKVVQMEVDAELENRGLENSEQNQHDPDLIPDHRLQLIFSCCHPSIAEKSRSALILKTVCGLSTQKIASAWLVTEVTMAQRLVRAKHKISKAGVPFSVPDQSAMPERLHGVLEVIYLIFNAGYQTTNSRELIDSNLCEEALYLGKLLLTLMPGETEVIGLVALMMFHHARADARISVNGDLITMADQNREHWNREDIATADKLLKGALMKGRPGSYQIQAAISAVHCHAETMEETDWQQILLLYHQLERYTSGPVVQVNLAVALSFAEGPQQAIRYLDQLADLEQLKHYHPYYVARADMSARCGQISVAVGLLETAISITDNETEARFLKTRILSLQAQDL